MAWTEVLTDQLPGSDRFGYWEAMYSQSLMCVTPASDHLDDFRAGSQALDLGTVQVFAQSYPSSEVFRSPRLIRRGDPEVFQIWLTVRGRIELEQAGRRAVVEEGDMVLYDSSRPMQRWTTALDRPEVSLLIVQVPQAALPLASDTLDRLAVTCISGRAGVGAVFRHYLTDLMAHAPTCEAADAPRLANITLDLCSAMLAQAARAGGRLQPEAHQAVLRAQVNAFITQRLADPDLTPAVIAAAHHISVRQLHNLYRDQGTTVAEGIRRSRLEGVRRDLVDPRLRARTIGAIAARWGFLNPAHFSRAFRAVYGTTAREHRHQVRSGEDTG